MNREGSRKRIEVYGLIVSVMLHVAVFAGVLFVKTGWFPGNYRVVNVFIAGNNAVHVTDNSAHKKEEKKQEQTITVPEPGIPATESDLPVLHQEVLVDNASDIKRDEREKPALLTEKSRRFETVKAEINAATPNEPVDQGSTKKNVSAVHTMIASENISDEGYYIGDFGEKNGPRFIERTHPSYPLMARRLGREGRVVLKLIIDEEGRLMDVQVVKSGGYGFDHSAVSAVRRSSFTPAVYKGQPIKSKTKLPIRFVLKEQ